ncbi:MAG: replicative DNA helicase, partial [Oscillospiraceae bacterium]|nr:replicative DNA helicase [Oscillospiraceae bacterium]
MDELTSRMMPHNTQAEQAVLGSMLIDSRCVADVIGAVKAEDFYISANREIFETIFAMFNYSQPVDAVTVLEQMRVRGCANDGTERYLRELMDITPTTVNVLEYAAIVRNNSLLRSIAATASEINGMAMDGGEAGAVLEAAEKRIYGIRKDRSIGGLKPVSAIMVEVYEQLREASKNNGGLPGVSTGLPEVDRKILGLQNSNLVLVASRPGMGKTSFALNVALNVGKATGKTIAIFSLEMSREQLAMRLVSSEAQVDSQKLSTGRLQASEWKRIAAAAASISATDLMIDDNPTISVSDMNAQCRRLPNLGLVVVDYLQLMQSADGKNRSQENRVQAVSDISRMMKIMAKELNVPVICLS